MNNSKNNIFDNSGGKPRIGLLPLYLKLYDDMDLRDTERVDGFYNTIADEFTKRGLEVITVPVCRIEDEFKKQLIKKHLSILCHHLAVTYSQDPDIVKTFGEMMGFDVVVID